LGTSAPTEETRIPVGAVSDVAALDSPRPPSNELAPTKHTKNTKTNGPPANDANRRGSPERWRDVPDDASTFMHRSGRGRCPQRPWTVASRRERQGAWGKRPYRGNTHPDGRCPMSPRSTALDRRRANGKPRNTPATRKQQGARRGKRRMPGGAGAIRIAVTSRAMPVPASSSAGMAPGANRPQRRGRP